MALAAKAKADADTDDSGDLGFYMPTVLAKSSPAKPPVQKITKKVRKKKVKPTKSSAKPAKKILSGPADNGLGLDQRKASSLNNPKLANSNPVLPGSTVSGGILKPAQSQAFMLESMDEKQILEYEIDVVKEKIRQKEDEARSELDKVRASHQLAIEQLQKRHEEKLKALEKEKTKLIEDKARTIDLEKQKLSQLHRIDID
jgi:hypothetical protein